MIDDLFFIRIFKYVVRHRKIRYNNSDYDFLKLKCSAFVLHLKFYREEKGKKNEKI